MYLGLHVKYPEFCQILMKLELFSTFFKNPEISNFMKICSVRTELFHADRWDGHTYMTKLTATFRNFANVPPKKDQDSRSLGQDLNLQPP